MSRLLEAEGRCRGYGFGMGGQGWETTPAQHLPRKQLKHRAVSSAKKEDDWFTILDPWISCKKWMQG